MAHEEDVLKAHHLTDCCGCPHELVEEATKAGFDFSSLKALLGPVLVALLQAFLAGKKAK